MKLLYISTLCAKSTYGEMFGYNSASPGFAVQKYHNVMANGFKENGETVICVTAPPVSRSNFKGLRADAETCTEDGILFSYIPTLNIPFIKNISVFFNTRKRCLKLLKESEKNGVKSGLVLDLLCISACGGALSALKSYNKKNHDDITVKASGIVTDVPEFLFGKDNGLLKKMFNKMFNGMFEKNLAGCDSYVFLTEQMNTLLNKQKNPYTVIEGQVSENVPPPPHGQGSALPRTRICMYAGSLCKIYGIVTLAEAFGELTAENGSLGNAELHIYGNGDSKDELTALSEKYPSVKYCGVLANDRIVEKEQEALLLINPRPTNEEYTKYSFPSKNMEYMASGTAVLTTDLPGMPEEYKKYVYIIEKEDKNGVKTALFNVLSSDDKDIREKGLSARQFVLTEKNSKIQAGKVLSLLR